MACLVSDATMCCAQGIYLLPDVRPSAESLPPDGAAVTVEGVVAPFTMEDGYETCRLKAIAVLDGKARAGKAPVLQKNTGVSKKHVCSLLVREMA